MHSSRMRTTCLLTVSHSAQGGLHPKGSAQPPGCRPPQMQTPWMQTPPGCTPPPLRVNRMTDRCRNITLPQTSFAGGNNKTINVEEMRTRKCKSISMLSTIGIHPRLQSSPLSTASLRDVTLSLSGTRTAFISMSLSHLQFIRDYGIFHYQSLVQ